MVAFHTVFFATDVISLGTRVDTLCLNRSILSSKTSMTLFMLFTESQVICIRTILEHNFNVTTTSMVLLDLPHLFIGSNFAQSMNIFGNFMTLNYSPHYSQIL
jgi:hypothetical protein